MYSISKKGARIIINDLTDFDLDQILDCGQCFRWKREDDTDKPTWYGVVDGSFARISTEKQKNDSDEFTSITIESYDKDESFWIKYLDLDRDYASIKNQLTNGDPVMTNAVREGEGIRILRQDVWETLISFIISQNSNIPRIRSCIESLCREFGKEIGEYKGEKMYSFPDLKTLASLKEDDLRVCRLGYRTKYIAEAARQISRDDGAVLDVAASMSDKDALKYLLGLSGIGPKVASCIMLFSMGKLNIFPIDVWVKRVMNRLYAINENDISAMKNYAEQNFGRYGGIAQQYLFYYIRKIADTKPELYKSLKINEDSVTQKSLSEKPEEFTP